MTTFNKPRCTFPVTLALCAAATSLASFALLFPASAQPEPKSDPHTKLLENADRTAKPGTLIVSDKSEGNETLAKAIADLGESPFAALYDAAGADARSFAQHNMTLSNPFFEGRVPGSRRNRVAAEYIEYYFSHAGLQPAFGSEEKAADGTPVITPNTSFRQPFAHGSEMKVHEAIVQFDLGGGGTVQLTQNEQFTVLGSSGSGKVTAPIVLVGYGIVDGPEGYSSFPKDADLTGKIAVVMRFEPMKANGKSKWVEDGWSPASSLDSKIQTIAEHHAAGIILVNPPGATDPRATQLVQSRDSRAAGNPLTIPAVMASADMVEKLIQASDPTDGPRRTLMDFRKQFDDKGGAIDFPAAKVSLTTRIVIDPIMTDNVGGVLRGKGSLKDEFIVIGAHYDHFCYGPVGTQPQNNGKLHPGADDNGSGTSGLLVVADKLSRAYAELPTGANARSVLFLAFSAEESGLIGSRYFVNHPSIALDKVDLMLNMDMIGRLREKTGLEVQGTESASGLYDWLSPYFDASKLKIAHGSDVAGNSDHASFYQKKLPVLFFFTGLHREYHTPQDTGFTVNQIGAGTIIDMVSRIALDAAQRPGRWTFTPRRQEQAADPHAGDQAQAAPPKGVGRVRFGVAPGSYSDDKPGVEVGDVYEGTSAADAGIKVGDRMIKWNGKPIENVEAWMPMLTAQKPGDEVEVTLLRDGKELTVKVKLKARDQGGR